jgi:hypothetical protein
MALPTATNHDLQNPHFRLNRAPISTESLMRPFLIVPICLALSLGGCLTRNQGPVTAVGNDDDDSYCRANNTVAPGSPDYVACRKDRDVQRQRAEAKADRRQRDLGEYMLNHPDRP